MVGFGCLVSDAFNTWLHVSSGEGFEGYKMFKGDHLMPKTGVLMKNDAGMSIHCFSSKPGTEMQPMMSPI